MHFVMAYLDDRPKIFLLLLTVEIAVDRRSCWCWEKPTLPYL